MQKYFELEKPFFDASKLRFLLLGDEKYKGLLHLCGCIEEDTCHYGCKHGLSLLNSILSIDKTMCKLFFHGKLVIGNIEAEDFQ